MFGKRFRVKGAINSNPEPDSHQPYAPNDLRSSRFCAWDGRSAGHSSGVPALNIGILPPTQDPPTPNKEKDFA